MKQFGIIFEISESLMAIYDGATIAEEINKALDTIGFIKVSKTFYRTTGHQYEPVVSIMKLNELRQTSPKFCECVYKVHVFLLDDLSDVTSLIQSSNEFDSLHQHEKSINQGIMNRFNNPNIDYPTEY